MKTEEILFILTFVFGVLHLPCIWLGVKFNSITEIFISKETIEGFNPHDFLAELIIGALKAINYCGQLFTYFSLCYQVWFWFIVKLNILN